jgi:diguanylate cyclase (GGDEF)-like protein
MKINIAKLSVLSRLLQRKRKMRVVGREVDLSAVLKAILTWANRFVPSESGSILLDDPIHKLKYKKNRRLYFAACYGRGSASLAGTYIFDKYGIAGETYRKGKPYISEDVMKDDKFYPNIDKKTLFETRSIICVPISIDGSIIGVIELINRKDRINYDRYDLAMLEIFAGYTATLIQNALIAESFEKLSKTDNLTGLHNDRYFFLALEREVRKILQGGGDVSLIFFDLDRFKEVNDNYGHLAGSIVLKEIADILRNIFSNSKAVAARYGGDEFVVIMPGVGKKEAGEYAEDIRQSVERNIFLKKKGPYGPPLNIGGIITCSIGVASLNKCSRYKGSIFKTVEALIKAADSAMYRAKDSGKNAVCFAKGKTKQK